MVDEIDNNQNDYELAGIGTAELAGIGAAESAAELISNDHNKNGEQTEETRFIGWNFVNCRYDDW